MVLICFYVSVYLMDTNTKKMEESNSNESIFPSTDEKSHTLTDAVDRSDTLLLEETLMVNPIILTNTCGSTEDTKMMESIVDEQIIAKNVTDELFPSTRVFPDVPFDSESTKEKQSEISSPNKRQEIDKDFPSTRVFPDVLFDSESTKKNQPKYSAVTEPTISFNDVKKDMFSVQDAFVFCPRGNTTVLNEVLQQGIFASEQEMDK